MKKSDIIKVLKPQGFVKAVGTTTYGETYYGRYGKGEIGALVSYRTKEKSYVIEASQGSITITPTPNNQDYNGYLDSICDILTANGIKVNNGHSYLSIYNQ